MANKWAELDHYDFKSESDPAAAYSEKLLALFDETIYIQPELAKEKPPLNILLATTKAILYPTFVNALMLDFLRLVTMIEFHRLRVLEQAQTMLEWHAYYEDTEDCLVGFEPHDLASVRQFVDGGPELRECFVRLLAQGCREDLERIWLSGTNTQFWIRWDDYFSIFKPNRTASSKVEPFHFELSTADVSQLRDAANEVIYFMQATTHYSIELKTKGEQSTPEAIYRLAVEDETQTTQFHEQLETVISSILDPETLEITEYYLEYINLTIPTIYDVLRRGDKRSAV